MHFTKMHGLGNDYLYVFGEVPENIAPLSIRLSDRHFGVGSDGMIYISPSAVADFRMRIFNADGSEAKMCGNGIRCVGKYVYEKGYTKKTRITVETLSGIKTLDLKVENEKVVLVTVDMGCAIAENKIKLCILDKNVEMTPTSVGNPHAVIFVENASLAPVDTVGPEIEHHPAFPGGVNVEFASLLEKNKLRMRVWERGSGITMACGTGACATVAAAIKSGLCDLETPVDVVLDGGTLTIMQKQDGTVIMTGPAAIVCEGDVEE